MEYDAVTRAAKFGTPERLSCKRRAERKVQEEVTPCRRPQNRERLTAASKGAHTRDRKAWFMSASMCSPRAS